MKALIMAGGRGTRLYPYTATMPKPLMPLGDTPILEVLLKRLGRAGVTEAILAVNHMGHLIQAFFGGGERFGMRISYGFEEKALGTAGPMASMLDELGADFIVTNGDLLTTLNVGAMIEAHQRTGADVTVGSFERQLESDFGILEVDGEMRLLEYREKPSYKHLVSMGIYVIKAASVRAYLRPEEYLDMPDLLRLLVDNGKTVLCYLEDCFWLDIGRPDDFAEAQQLYEQHPSFFEGA